MTLVHYIIVEKKVNRYFLQMFLSTTILYRDTILDIEQECQKDGRKKECKRVFEQVAPEVKVE